MCHPSPGATPASVPRQHLPAGARGTLLATQFSARAARLGTLHGLTQLAPVEISADALGYAPTTIAHHATDSSAGYAQYIAAIRATQGLEPTS